MTTKSWKFGLVVVLVLSGCGELSGGPCNAEGEKGYVGCVEGISVLIDNETNVDPGDALNSPDGLLSEVETAVALASDVWGVGMDHWSGYRVTIRAACDRCGSTWAQGCTERNDKSIWVVPVMHCRPWNLVHELGHAAGVDSHEDPRFAVAASRAPEVCGL